MENLEEAGCIKIPKSLGGHKTRGVFEGQGALAGGQLRS